MYLCIGYQVHLFIYVHLLDVISVRVRKQTLPANTNTRINTNTNTRIIDETTIFAQLKAHVFALYLCCDDNKKLAARITYTPVYRIGLNLLNI